MQHLFHMLTDFEHKCPLVKDNCTFAISTWTFYWLTSKITLHLTTIILWKMDTQHHMTEKPPMTDRITDSHEPISHLHYISYTCYQTIYYTLPSNTHSAILLIQNIDNTFQHYFWYLHFLSGFRHVCCTECQHYISFVPSDQIFKIFS